jgi:tetratricopeptide (TPR) repeat protein
MHSHHSLARLLPRTFLLAGASALAIAPSVHAQTEGRELPPGFEDAMPLRHGTGLGHYSRQVTTDSPEAQLYFDQGMQLLYAFTPRDAARSFREAWRHDPGCAMCYFGEAWAFGGYLNGPMTTNDNPHGHAAIQRALELAPGNTTPVERALIEAMAVRFEPEFDRERRRELDEQYAAAMNEVYERFPSDLEAGFLAAEALMLLQPRRGLWDIENPDVQEIHKVLESVLDQLITHPGACHLYVHATEPTQRPGKAEACAQHLGQTIPGASHIQHMPSHTWNRVGRWGDAVRSNMAAWHADLAAEHGEGFAIYPSHNVHMLLFAASNDGQGAVAYAAAEEYARLMDGDTSYEALTLFRFGKFQKIMELDSPPEGAIYRGLWDFAKGYAALRLGDEGTARWYLGQVEAAARETPEDITFRGHTPAQLLGVVSGILEGEILRANGEVGEAVEVLETAVAIEDGLRYDEPEPLNFSVRQWLGDALHEAGRYREAAEVFRAELEDHPNNGWSLFGLERALRAAGDDAEADRVHAQLEQAWARSDTYLRGPVF